MLAREAISKKHTTRNCNQEAVSDKPCLHLHKVAYIIIEVKKTLHNVMKALLGHPPFWIHSVPKWSIGV